jgi:hypothetical protein
VRYLVPLITRNTLTGAVREQGAEGDIVTQGRGSKERLGKIAGGELHALTVHQMILGLRNKGN